MNLRDMLYNLNGALLIMKEVFIFLLTAAIGAGLMIRFLGASPSSPPKSVKNSQSVTPTHSFSIENPPSETLKGSILARSGVIRWQSRVATEPAVLDNPRPIQQGESVSTDDSGKITIEFKDACLLTVSPESKIEFLQTLPDHLVLAQPAGTVTYHNTAVRPVAVRSRHLLAEIQGDATLAVNPVTSSTVITVSREVTVAFNDTDFVTVKKTLTTGRYEYDDEERTITSL